MEHGEAAEGLIGAGAAWLQATALGAAMRESLYLYPLANLLHLLGLVMLIGGIGLLDLRLIGLGRRLPVREMSRFLTPIGVTGLVLMLATGTALFSADAGPLARGDVFQTKIVLVAIAVVNAILFRLLWQRRLADWDARPPIIGRIQALGSVGLWLSAATFGRLIAYG